MKKVTAEHHYTIDAEVLSSFFTEESKVAAKYVKLGNKNYRLKSAEQSGSELHIDARHEAPAGSEVPAALKKFAGEYNKVRQREIWADKGDGSKTCQLRIDLDGVPVKIKGEMVITPTEQGCVNNVTMEVSCGLPLIGKMAAEFVGKSIQAHMEEEYNYIKSA